MAKPSYKQARDKRGTSDMEIEPATPGTKIVDKTKPEPHTEELVPPYPAGKKPMGISPSPVPDSSGHAEPGTVGPNDYTRPAYTGITKT